MLRGLGDYERNTRKRHRRSLGIKYSKRAFEPIEIQYIQGLWIGPITVGTPEVEYTVNFDTGSGAFFLATEECKSCLPFTLYDPDSSSTAVSLSRDFDFEYADGSRASGKLYTDTVRIGDFTATQQTLGAASEWTKLERTLDDGVIGLGFPCARMGNALPVFQNLIQQRQTDSPVFTMKLVEGNAVLTLGGLNGDLYNEPITYVDVISEEWWIIESDSLSVDGQVILGKIPCLIDSACSN
jgi:cathepsin D